MTQLQDLPIIFPYFSSSKNIIAEASNFHSSLRFVQVKVPFFLFFVCFFRRKKENFSTGIDFHIIYDAFLWFLPKAKKEALPYLWSTKKLHCKNRKTISQKRKIFSASGKDENGKFIIEKWRKSKRKTLEKLLKIAGKTLEKQEWNARKNVKSSKLWRKFTFSLILFSYSEWAVGHCCSALISISKPESFQHVTNPTSSPHKFP